VVRERVGVVGGWGVGWVCAGVGWVVMVFFFF